MNSEQRKLLLTLAYDGTDFCGYQTQDNGPTVQAALNASAENLFGYPCDVTGCSRTDSGVHARMFCATVARAKYPSLVTSIPTEQIPRAFNVRLPKSISVYNAVWVPESFHPRYDVSSKEYVYRFINAKERSPFFNNYAWWIPQTISEQSVIDMNRAARYFAGEHDFSSCMAQGSNVKSTVRTIFNADVRAYSECGERLIDFYVRGDGFLYNMVRIMAGTLIDVALGKKDPESIPSLLAAKDRSGMGKTAPPHGLYLNRVFYQSSEKPGYQSEVIV